jgi:glycosyltransferase involved in cell wall biosynthesis
VARERPELRRDCAVVICTRNRPEELESCLNAVFAQTLPASEILVVDNAPGDARTLQVASRWGVRYVVEPVPGLSRARNCRSEIIAFLDDDCLPEPGWLVALVAEFDDPNIAIVTGRVLPVSVSTDSERIVAAVGGQGPAFRERRALDSQSPHWFGVANFGGAGDGNNMAFRRSVFDDWPGFDERLGRGAPIDGNEEHYAFFQLIDRGYALVYTPNAVVRHPYADTIEKLRASALPLESVQVRR